MEPASKSKSPDMGTVSMHLTKQERMNVRKLCLMVISSGKIVINNSMQSKQKIDDGMRKSN